jgi:hypothetical protein
MGALRGGECANHLPLVSVISRVLEVTIADFRASIAPDHRLRFGSTMSFVV